MMRHSQSPPLLDLVLTYDQWKEEHDSLHRRLLDLCRFMKWNPVRDEMEDWEDHHQEVRKAFIPFMLDWQRHLSREVRTIYPFAKSATCAGRIGPVGVLEQDGTIAAQYYETYLKAVEAGAPAEEALPHLLQVLMIVAEHFRIEDETVVPATEQLMNEIAYSGS
ncbi:hypothetical protein [Cohnella candidum]|uniref:Hemerythrin domain-containing protein n=1 Tax=Cohnella candidum TaxID=2674991 RepID=A0A3G3JVQ4_9BACL|nr:hypothetical protein [Cohnella candidum]AYQ72312.1 hypothetical protein EAV92_06850 [Cohnella candidum]